MCEAKGVKVIAGKGERDGKYREENGIWERN